MRLLQEVGDARQGSAPVTDSCRLPEQSFALGLERDHEASSEAKGGVAAGYGLTLNVSHNFEHCGTIVT
jgi:hypothetical protein